MKKRTRQQAASPTLNLGPKDPKSIFRKFLAKKMLEQLRFFRQIAVMRVLAFYPLLTGLAARLAYIAVAAGSAQSGAVASNRCYFLDYVCRIQYICT